MAVIIIDAFAEIPSLIDNDEGVVSAGGELSPLAKAYSTDVKTYTDDVNYPGVSLKVFSSKSDGNDIAIPSAGYTKALEVSHTILNNYTGGGGRAFIETNFPDFTNVSTDADVVTGGTSLISRLECNFTVGSDVVLLRLFMASEFFETNYEEYTIKIIPPLSPVTGLLDNYNVVDTKIKQTTAAEIAAIENETRDNKPNSHRTVYTLRWKDINDNELKTDWIVLGYGVASMRTDNILEAIREYLVANSSSPISTWKTYLPDIEVEDNFTFIPVWSNIAVSAGGSVDAYYNPIIATGKIGDIGFANFATRSKTEYETQAEIVTMRYKSLAMITIGGLGNTDQERLFSTMYPKYTIFRTGDAVGGEIPQTVLDVITALETLAALCEVYDGTQILPGSVIPLDIDGKTFLETAVDGMLLKMLTKLTFQSV